MTKRRAREEALPLGAPLLRCGWSEVLRDVVAHAGEDHVVDRLGGSEGLRWRSQGAADESFPGGAREIAVGALVLQAAILGAVDEPVGEADGAFLDVAGGAEPQLAGRRGAATPVVPRPVEVAV